MLKVWRGEGEKKQNKTTSALKPSASGDKKLRSIPFSHCSDGSNTNTCTTHQHTHSENRRTRTLVHIWWRDYEKTGFGWGLSGIESNRKKKKKIPGNELVQLKLREANGITHALQIIRSYSIINVWNELNKETNIGNINVFSQKLLIWRNMATSKVFSINKDLNWKDTSNPNCFIYPKEFFLFPPPLTFSWLILSCSRSSDWTLRSSTSSRKCCLCLDDSSSSSLRHASSSRAETPFSSYSRHMYLFNTAVLS